MMPDEEDQLLTIFEPPQTWRRNAEAHDGRGEAVRYEDSLCLPGDAKAASCLLFDRPSTCAQLEPFDRHIYGKGAESGWSLNDSEMDAKAALQKFNGCAGASLEWLPKRIESLPVRRGNAGHEPRFQDGWISEKVKFDVRKET
ncbi:MAG: hypothetical protein AABZ12_04310 [Planctomycetota bacterium]|mgnify:CR=1 FL=1